MNDAHGFRWQPLASATPMWRTRVTGREWRELAASLRREGVRLAALWATDDRGRGEGFRVQAAWYERSALRVADLALPPAATHYPTLASIFPAATRLERAAFDMVGLRAQSEDTRPWLRHASWPADYHPLRSDSGQAPNVSARVEDYAFVRVAGDGVHEIPVGPVHAGVIEPGHFRFSVVGEKVLRLEERLGYVHKGIERRFQDFGLLDGQRLAARVSGDSCVAFSWAYCRALEAMSGCEVPARAAWLRASALELERLANHLGDLGALGNDAGFAFGLAQFSRLKETLLRAVEAAFGARYLMGFVVPGGLAWDAPEDARRELLERLAAIEREALEMRAIYEDHPGLHDRFSGAGRIDAALAAQLELTGLAGRASGQAFDLRVDQPFAPYTDAQVRMATDERGDVLARVTVRFDEAFESIRLCRMFLETLPLGAVRLGIETPADGAFGCGVLEGWRGPVLVALEAGREGRIHRCHPHDPSWQNWPVLEHAVIDNIVPDFPLINKSFNLSYSGHDL